MKLVNLFIILAIQFSYGQDTLFLDGNWKPIKKTSATYYRIDKKENEIWRRRDFFVEGDQLQMTGLIKSIDPEIKEGKFEYFHSNGKLKHFGDYKDNKETGEHKWYSNNGALEAIENYNNDKLSGSFREYHPNARLSIEANFEHGG